MAITDDILEQNQPQQPQQQNNWLKDLIAQRYQPKTERIKRSPVGFNFEREPFDPSSYYRQLGTFRDISQAATEVTRVEAQNAAAKAAAQSVNIGSALGGVSANFVYSGKSRKYGLKNVSPNTARAADAIGSMFGIKNVGGYRAHGSVPGSDHPKGRATDFMTYKNMSQGTALANYVVKNYKAYNVKYVIWNRRIWSPGKGWRKYSGPSPHTDHVHVSYTK